MADGAKPDVPTTDVENDKKKTKHRVFYEAVDAHARRRLTKELPFYESGRRMRVGRFNNRIMLQTTLTSIKLLLIFSED